ncbi:MmcQ/YjbR family DNA-binding protein [Kribbella sp. CA-253562]|uniref:MmcQ/YjbR family DNA-binding protein n=1 Tax=Kribbella sp. CA-253562 TaxID=3239942 RepID=UPI003D8F35CF
MRSDRRRGQDLLDELSTAYDGLPGVDRSLMFGSEGLRVGTKFFAFVGAEGELIVKLPADRVAGLLAANAAEPVHIGRNPAKEWAGIPYPPADNDQWRDLLAEAHAFVAAEGGRPTRPRRRATKGR